MGNVYFTGFKANAFPYEDIMGDQYYNKYSPAGELLSTIPVNLLSAGSYIVKIDGCAPLKFLKK